MWWNWDIVRTFPCAGDWKFLKWISGVLTQPPTETRHKAEEAPPPCFSKENNRMWTVNGTGETTLEWVPTANAKLLQLSVASSAVWRLREPAAAKETPCGHLRNFCRKPGTTMEFKKTLGGLNYRFFYVELRTELSLSSFFLFFKKKFFGHIWSQLVSASQMQIAASVIDCAAMTLHVKGPDCWFGKNHSQETSLASGRFSRGNDLCFTSNWK